MVDNIPIHPIIEKIVRTDIIATAFNRDRLGQNAMKRIVDLECGHKAITTNSTRARCRRCEEMLRRSIDTGEEDYETYRYGDKEDEMIWRDDPLRFFNERTNLAGEFIND